MDDDNRFSSETRDTENIDFIKKGILQKKGRGKLLRPWTLRTVYLLNNKKLSYYDGSVLKGEINLDGVRVRFLSPDEADGKDNAFEISNIVGIKVSQGSTLVLACGSKVEADNWVESLSSEAFCKLHSRSAEGPTYETLDEMLLMGPVEPLDTTNMRELRKAKSVTNKKIQSQKEMKRLMSSSKATVISDSEEAK